MKPTHIVWKILPWFLLAGIAAMFWWFYQSVKVEREAHQWEPPREEVVDRSTSMVKSYHGAVEAASKSVVNIYTTQKVKQHPYMDDPVLKRFFEFQGRFPEQKDSTNLGSGVVVSKDGYIVTNSHVISGADDITVAFNDGKKAKAEIVGADPESDLAVIKVNLTNLKPLPFRSQDINVGDVVLAIGNPFGVGQTVTQGIISATGRTGLGINTFEDFIQTDAAINPGNSGGALVDANGQLIGINTAIFSRSGGNMGIGFAIPTPLVEQVMNAIIKDGKVTRGWLGIEVRSNADNPVALTNNRGVEVMNVVKSGPAAKSGVLTGDVILSLNGVEMNNPNDLIQYVARQSPQSVLSAVILRKEKEQTLAITLGERPSQKKLMEDSRTFSQDSENLNEQDQGYTENAPDYQGRQDIPKELLEMFQN